MGADYRENESLNGADSSYANILNSTPSHSLERSQAQTQLPLPEPPTFIHLSSEFYPLFLISNPGMFELSQSSYVFSRLHPKSLGIVIPNREFSRGITILFRNHCGVYSCCTDSANLRSTASSAHSTFYALRPI